MDHRVFFDDGASRLSPVVTSGYGAMFFLAN